MFIMVINPDSTLQSTFFFGINKDILNSIESTQLELNEDGVFLCNHILSEYQAYFHSVDRDYAFHNIAFLMICSKYLFDHFANDDKYFISEKIESKAQKADLIKLKEFLSEAKAFDSNDQAIIKSILIKTNDSKSYTFKSKFINEELIKALLAFENSKYEEYFLEVSQDVELRFIEATISDILKGIRYAAGKSNWEEYHKGKAQSVKKPITNELRILSEVYQYSGLKKVKDSSYDVNYLRINYNRITDDKYK